MVEYQSKECIMNRGSKSIDGMLITVENIGGINFPFQIYIPSKRQSQTSVILANTTPRTMKTYTFDESLRILKGESRICNDGTLENTEKNKYINGVNPMIRYLSYNCGSVCIIPCIPRPIGFDSSYLGYKVYNNQFDTAFSAIEEGKSKFTKSDIEKYRDLDVQVYRMIQYSMLILDQMNIDHDEKVIVTGYSAEAKFSNFFTALHPDIVKAVIAGGTGGNNIIPNKNINQQFPVGVSDITNFDLEAFSSIPQFYFIGSSDYNDVSRFKPKYELETKESLIKKYGRFMKDIDGNLIPRRNDGLKGFHDEIIGGEVKHISDRIAFDKIDYDLDENGQYQVAYDEGYYTIEQISFIIKSLGDNVQDRFDKISELYKQIGIKAIFKKYPGNHQTVFNNKELFEDTNDFLKQLYKSKENNRKSII